MRPSSRWTLVLVVLCALGVVGALGWASVHALRLERAELQARSEAHLHESIRLALWRMDSAINSIVSRESARPYFQYAAFYPADRAYTSMWEEKKPGEVLVPSPLLNPDDRLILLHFQRDQKGTLTSPQAPAGNMRDLAEALFVSSDRVIAAQARLDDLSRLFAVPADTGQQVAQGGAGRSGGFREGDETRPAGQPAPGAIADFKDSVPTQSLVEYEARQQAAEQARAPQQERRKAQNVAATPPPAASEPLAAASARGRVTEKAELENKSRLEAGAGGDAALKEGAKLDKAIDTVKRSLDADNEKQKFGQARDDWAMGPTLPDVEQGEFAPAWKAEPDGLRQVLLLLRKIRIGGTEIEQGCWLDWDALRGSLLESTRDLLPEASLTPLLGADAARPELLGRRLAGIAAELEPGPVLDLPIPAWTPMRTTLVVTWVAVLLALVAVAVVLHAAQELAERRGRFVSAVTHELRTPLTTFCLYSQMLADGMVGDEPSRTEYLGTLKRESQRLARIVENVLEFARLGRRAEPKRTERLTVPALLSRLAPTLEQRAAQAGLRLVMEPMTPEVGEMTVCVDPLTVERILFNLVDNACKYAADCADASVELGARDGKGMIEFSVTDHGRGVDPGVRGLMFRPFQRGHSLAHASTPGLGLGLALSRGLARQLGGDLALERSTSQGSRFILTLPAEHDRT